MCTSKALEHVFDTSDQKLLLLCLPLADEDRVQFMTSLSLKYGLTHTIRRSNVRNNTVQLQPGADTTGVPISHLVSLERAVDLGGVTRDMFSAFYDKAYEKLFDESSLLCPIVHPEADMSLLTTMGFVISHLSCKLNLFFRSPHMGSLWISLST